MTGVKLLMFCSLFVCASAQIMTDDSDGDFNPRVELKVVTDFERDAWTVAAELYRAVNNTVENELRNFVMSPLSLTTSMIMLYAGSDGETAEEIQKVFKFGNDSSFSLMNHTEVLNLLKTQTKDEADNDDLAFELVTASRIFSNKKNANLRENYKAAVSSLGGVETLDFSDPTKIVEKMNEWVQSETRGKISKITEDKDFDKETAAVLLNALYFKAPWKHPFNISQTTKDIFYTGISNRTVDVDMMHVNAEFLYADLPDAGASAIFLPFSDERINMIIYVPNQRSRLAKLEEKLNTLVPSQVLNQATPTSVSFFLPKFNFSSSLDFKRILSSMGIKKMFKGDEANFTGISESKQFHVSKLRQQVLIEVNEKGTEAAAITETYGVVAVSAPFTLKINRPFVFQVYDNRTGTILLSGRIMNPKGNVPKKANDSNSNSSGNSSDTTTRTNEITLPDSASKSIYNESESCPKQLYELQAELWNATARIKELEQALYLGAVGPVL